MLHRILDHVSRINSLCLYEKQEVAGLAYRRELVDMTVRNPNKSEETSDKQIHFDYPIVLFSSFAQLVEALQYKPDGRGFDFRWGHWDFSLA